MRGVRVRVNSAPVGEVGGGTCSEGADRWGEYIVKV